MSAADGINEVLAIEGKPGTDRTAPGGELAASVEFDHVRLTDLSRDEPAADDVSLSIAPGETVAVVGPSGSGKTSLVSLPSVARTGSSSSTAAGSRKPESTTPTKTGGGVYATLTAAQHVMTE